MATLPSGPAAGDGADDPATIRAELRVMLAEARVARTMPWPPSKLLLYRTIFPQMIKALPDAEAAQWRADFEAELKRLEGA